MRFCGLLRISLAVLLSLSLSSSYRGVSRLMFIFYKRKEVKSMSAFVAELMEVLNISLTIGTTTITLGGLAIGTALLGAGLGLYRGIKGRR